MDVFSVWDGFSESSEEVFSTSEKGWMIEFPMQIHHQTSSGKADALGQEYMNCLLIKQDCLKEKLADKVTAQLNRDRSLTVHLNAHDHGFIDFDHDQFVSFCSKASSGGLNASGEISIDITFGGGKEEPTVSVGGSMGVSDNQGNSASIGVEYDSSKSETTVSISAEGSTQGERPGD